MKTVNFAEDLDKIIASRKGKKNFSNTEVTVNAGWSEKENKVVTEKIDLTKYIDLAHFRTPLNPQGK